MIFQKHQVSNEQNPGWLEYIRDFTTQLCGDYNKPFKDPYKPISILECHKCFERCSGDLRYTGGSITRLSPATN